MVDRDAAKTSLRAVLTFGLIDPDRNADAARKGADLLLGLPWRAVAGGGRASGLSRRRRPCRFRGMSGLRHRSVLVLRDDAVNGRGPAQGDAATGCIIATLPEFDPIAYKIGLLPVNFSGTVAPMASVPTALRHRIDAVARELVEIAMKLGPEHAGLSLMYAALGDGIAATHYKKYGVHEFVFKLRQQHSLIQIDAPLPALFQSPATIRVFVDYPGLNETTGNESSVGPSPFQISHFSDPDEH
jgi:hypothetical protein